MSRTRTTTIQTHHSPRCRCPNCPINNVNKPVKEWIYQLDKEERLEVALTLFMRIDDEVRLGASVSQAVSTSLEHIDKGYSDVKGRMGEIVEQYTKQLEQQTGKSRHEIEELIKNKISEVQDSLRKVADTNQKDTEKFLKLLVETKIEELKKRINELIQQGKSVDEIKESLMKNTNEQIENIRKELVESFRDILKQLGFPEAKQVEALQQVIPIIQNRMEELLNRMTIPSQKGEWGETELYEQLNETFPEDRVSRVGGPGRPDIVSKPRYNGVLLSSEIVIESKTEKKWKEDFVEEIQRHMKARKASYGILAVEKTPSGARECMPRECAEGMVLVVSRDSAIPAYAALRTLLGIDFSAKAQEQSLRRVLGDARLLKAIEDARGYEGMFESIRNNARKIEEHIDEATKLLRVKLDFLETRIRQIAAEIATEDTPGT